MIRRAHSADRQRLEEIYDACFPGEPGFRAWFFDNVWQAENTLVFEDEGQIISCLQDIPVTAAWGGEAFLANYIYAAGTLPHARGRGIMGQLLGQSFKDGVARGQDFSLLITQNQSLFDFYRSFGYDIISRISSKTVDSRPLPAGYQIRPAQAGDIPAVMELFACQTAGYFTVARDELHMGRMLELYEDNFAVLLDGNGAVRAYAFTEKNQGRLIVLEGIGPEIETLAGGLGNQTGLECVLNGVAIGPEDEPLGCIKPLTAKGRAALEALLLPPYLNMMFN